MARKIQKLHAKIKGENNGFLGVSKILADFLSVC